ncbi:MAG: IPT/TIG domain-containing protein [Williamsia herbipolensis]|nr:IPT/TIG domain-containing protein [Williamsia herbipolensis]
MNRPSRAALLAAGATATVAALAATGLLAGPAGAAALHHSRPSVDELSTHAGATAGGTKVVVRGRDFTHVRGVYFGAKRGQDLRVTNDHRLVVDAPRHTAGQVDVTVRTADGTSRTTHGTSFRFVAPPTVSSLTPSSGGAGKQTVVVRGTNFIGRTSVLFGRTPGTHVRVLGPTRLSVQAPAKGSGTVTVSVHTAFGRSSASRDARYSFSSGPQITSISPAQALTTASPTVTLHGSGFSAANPHVVFGSAKAVRFTVVSDQVIRAVAPQHSAGTVDVRVSTTEGTSPKAAADEFEFGVAPTVTSVGPKDGASGDTVVVTGTGFTDDSAVAFGATHAKGVTVVSDTKLRATVPNHSGGTVDVTVSTPFGTSPVSSKDAFTFTTAPASLACVSVPVLASDSVRIAWPASTLTHVSGYEVRGARGTVAPANAHAGVLIADLKANRTSYSDDDLRPSMTYSYSVFAIQGSTYSAPASITVQTPSGDGPAVPTSVGVETASYASGFSGCASTAVWAGAPGKNVTLAAHVSDSNRSKSLTAMFKVVDVAGGKSVTVASKPVRGVGNAFAQLPTSGLADGHEYALTVRTFDGKVLSAASTPFYFRVDASAPDLVRITSSDFPVRGGGKIKGQTGKVHFSAIDPSTNGMAGHVTTFVWSTKSAAAVRSDAARVVRANGDAPATATVKFTPASWGKHTIYMAAVDRVGNMSRVVSYTFDVSD